jgi:2-polyprenyl-3-methyl-5-hydroxy-6-metoxy-1,4-benzoquinol methylase
MSDHPHDHGHHHGDEPLTLEERHEHERDFYDQWAIDEFAEAPDEVLKVDGSVIPFPNQQHVDFLTYAIDQIRPMEGKKILEAGTGSGHLAAWFASNGAEATGFDVSPGILEVAKRRAKVNGVEDRTRFIEGSAEYLDEPDDTYDVIFGNQVAHHFDLALAGQNFERMLKPGGIAVFAEPILFGPEWVRNFRHGTFVTRWIPSAHHTPDERSFNREDLDDFTGAFAHSEWEAFQLFGRLQNLIWWELSPAAWSRLERIDHFVLEKVPGTEAISRFLVVTMRAG